jgi:hypothetical protein
MKTVYRVQNTESIGPYIGNGAFGDWYWKMLDHHCDHNHPNRREDGFLDLGFTTKHVFGFDSIDKLKWWFDEYLIHLIYAGFIIAKYEVDDYILGDSGKQVIFIPTTFEDITSQFLNLENHAHNICKSQECSY